MVGRGALVSSGMLVVSMGAVGWGVVGRGVEVKVGSGHRCFSPSSFTEPGKS